MRHKQILLCQTEYVFSYSSAWSGRSFHNTLNFSYVPTIGYPSNQWNRGISLFWLPNNVMISSLQCVVDGMVNSFQLLYLKPVCSIFPLHIVNGPSHCCYYCSTEANQCLCYVSGTMEYPLYLASRVLQVCRLCNNLIFTIGPSYVMMVPFPWIRKFWLILTPQTDIIITRLLTDFVIDKIPNHLSNQ